MPRRRSPCRRRSGWRHGAVGRGRAGDATSSARRRGRVASPRRPPRARSARPHPCGRRPCRSAPPERRTGVSPSRRRSNAMTRAKARVFPVPGPPAMTVRGRRSMEMAAWRWRSGPSHPVREPVGEGLSCGARERPRREGRTRRPSGRSRSSSRRRRGRLCASARRPRNARRATCGRGRAVRWRTRADAGRRRGRRAVRRSRSPRAHRPTRRALATPARPAPRPRPLRSPPTRRRVRVRRTRGRGGARGLRARRRAAPPDRPRVRAGRAPRRDGCRSVRARRRRRTARARPPHLAGRAATAAGMQAASVSTTSSVHHRLPSSRSLNATVSEAGMSQPQTPNGRPSTTGVPAPTMPRTKRYAAPERWRAGS